MSETPYVHYLRPAIGKSVVSSLNQPLPGVGDVDGQRSRNTSDSNCSCCMNKCNTDYSNNGNSNNSGYECRYAAQRDVHHSASLTSMLQGNETTVSQSANYALNEQKKDDSFLPACSVSSQQAMHAQQLPTSLNPQLSQQKEHAPSRHSKALPALGIPVSRYRGKLEECSKLYRCLQETATELHVTQENVISINVEYEKVVQENCRLRDMLNMTTTELQTMQQRVKYLEREMMRLCGELRSQQKTTSSVLSNKRLELPFTIPVTEPCRAPVCASFNTLTYPKLPKVKNNNQSCLVLSTDSTQFKTNELFASSYQQKEQIKTTEVLVAYVGECFRTNVLPHIELLHSLYDGGRIMAVTPPITHNQLTALKQLLTEATEPASCTVNNTDTASLLLSMASWARDVEIMSLRCDKWHSCIGLVLHLIRFLPSLRYVELFAIDDANIMQLVSETLLMTSRVKELSLPELRLTDDGVKVLFSLIKKQELMENSKLSTKTVTQSLVEGKDEVLPDRPACNSFINTTISTVNKAYSNLYDDWNRIFGTTGHGGSGGASSNLGSSSSINTISAANINKTSQIAVHILDLSRCTITHPTTVFHSFTGASVEVLLLTGCAGLLDVHIRCVLEACPRLHTADFSGCGSLTATCITYINQHPRLKVLRLENCPLIKRLDLANVEVLLSSLAHVTTLRAPKLRRLPVPLTHSQVLFDFYAPKLEELTLKGISIDSGTLAAFINATSSILGNTAAEQVSSSPIITQSASTKLLDTKLPEEGFEEKEQEVPQLSKCEDVPQLLFLGFIDCLIASPQELQLFIGQQSRLLRLSLHGCQGVVDAHLAKLPSSLIELDLGGALQLTGGCINAIVTQLPYLKKLNLKNAGSAIQNTDIRRLHCLGSIEVLNLLGLPQLLPEVVSAVAEALRNLRVLYHETAVVESVGPTKVLLVERSDEEDAMRREIKDCAKELLELRNESALALWIEAQLPKLTEHFSTYQSETQKLQFGIRQPSFVANTTFYEVTQQLLLPSGTSGSTFTNENFLGTDKIAESLRQEKPDVLILTEDKVDITPTHPLYPIEESNSDDDNDRSKTTADDVCHTMEATITEKDRLAIERAPIGPWDEADIVAERRRQSGS